MSELPNNPEPESIAELKSTFTDVFFRQDILGSLEGNPTPPNFALYAKAAAVSREWDIYWFGRESSVASYCDTVVHNELVAGRPMQAINSMQNYLEYLGNTRQIEQAEQYIQSIDLDRFPAVVGGIRVPVDALHDRMRYFLASHLLKRGDIGDAYRIAGTSTHEEQGMLFYFTAAHDAKVRKDSESLTMISEKVEALRTIDDLEKQQVVEAIANDIAGSRGYIAVEEGDIERSRTWFDQMTETDLRVQYEMRALLSMGEQGRSHEATLVLLDALDSLQIDVEAGFIDKNTAAIHCMGLYATTYLYSPEAAEFALVGDEFVSGYADYYHEVFDGDKVDVLIGAMSCVAPIGDVGKLRQFYDEGMTLVPERKEELIWTYADAIVDHDYISAQQLFNELSDDIKSSTTEEKIIQAHIRKNPRALGDWKSFLRPSIPDDPHNELQNAHRVYILAQTALELKKNETVKDIIRSGKMGPLYTTLFFYNVVFPSALLEE